MRAAESQFSGWKRHGGNARPAAMTAVLLSCIFRILQQFQIFVFHALRRSIVVAVVVGLVFAPLPLAFASGTPENPAHAMLDEQDVADHGHSHDDDEPHGPFTSHTHGHDPADHSHQYAFLSGGSGQWGLPPPLHWPSALSGRPDGALGFGIERPPKRTMSL